MGTCCLLAMPFYLFVKSFLNLKLTRKAQSPTKTKQVGYTPEFNGFLGMPALHLSTKFHEIWLGSFCVILLIDRQTNKGNRKHNLLGGGNQKPLHRGISKCGKGSLPSENIKTSAPLNIMCKWFPYMLSAIN